MNHILDKLTDYTLSLKTALNETSAAEERPLLTARLAAAAEMYAQLHKERKIESIEATVKSEIRAHGWSFISGENGSKVAEKWVAFTKSTCIEY